MNIKSISNIFSLNSSFNKSQIEAYYEEVAELGLKRLWILNLAILLLSVYLFYSDHYILNSVDNLDYRQGLIFIHQVVFLVSVFYLILLKFMRQFQNVSRSFKICLVHIFFMISLFVGIFISLNSLQVSLSITSYVTILMCTASFLPISPIPAILISSLMQGGFVYLLNQMSDDRGLNAIQQINSMVALLVSMVIMVTVYTYRRNDFLSRLRLIESEKRMEKIFEINPFPLFLISLKDFRCIKMNSKAKEHYQQDEEGINSSEFLNYFVRAEDFNQMLIQFKTDGFISERVIELKDENRKTWIMCNCELLEYNGENCALAGLIDITKLKTLENDLAIKASIDILTGLFNRAKGLELISELLEEKTHFTIAFCDINSLKAINDGYGHVEGDRIISIVADTIMRFIETEDFAFRYGGDEFIIIFRNTKDKNYEITLEQINASLNDSAKELQLQHELSISYGFALVDENTDYSITNLIKIADEKMYHNKEKSQTNFKNLDILVNLKPD